MTQNEQCINLFIIMISQLYRLYNLLNFVWFYIVISHYQSIHLFSPSIDTSAFTEHVFENK